MYTKTSRGGKAISQACWKEFVPVGYSDVGFVFVSKNLKRTHAADKFPRIPECRLPLDDFENLCQMNQVSPEEVLEALNFLSKETGAFGSWDVG